MLLLRSMDRAQEIYHSMQMRGFSGRDIVVSTDRKRLSKNDYLYCVMICGVLILIRIGIEIGVL